MLPIKSRNTHLCRRKSDEGGTHDVSYQGGTFEWSGRVQIFKRFDNIEYIVR